MNAAVACGFISTLFVVVAANQFHKVYQYAERLVERLERDKKLLAILEQEKAVLDSKKMNSSAEAALNSLINNIAKAINSVIQPTVAPAAASCPAPMAEIPA